MNNINDFKVGDKCLFVYEGVAWTGIITKIVQGFHGGMIYYSFEEYLDKNYNVSDRRGNEYVWSLELASGTVVPDTELNRALFV